MGIHTCSKHNFTGTEYCPECVGENDYLRAENERLREKLDDLSNYYKNAMREGAPDEVHCSCVPALKKEVERLREVVQAVVTARKNSVAHSTGIRIFKADVDKIDAALKKLEGR